MTEPVVLEIFGPYTRIRGDFPKQAVREVTSYPVQGANFSEAFRRGVWDGRKHLFRASSNTFPTGLLSFVTEVLDVAGTPYTIVDNRIKPEPLGKSFDLVGVSMTGKYQYQMDTVKTAIEKEQGVLRLATGAGKTEVACAITKYLGLPTLFIVTTVELLYQARERFIKRLDLDETAVGIIGDSKWEPGTWVTIATVATLERRLDTTEAQEFLSNVKVLFLDEAHHAGSDTVFEVCASCPAYYRYGLSGTPLDRTDGANLRLLAAIGPVIVDVPNKKLMELGISARTSIIFTKVTQPVLKKRLPYSSAYKHGVTNNPHHLSLVVEWTKVFHEVGLSTLILCEEISHGKAIDEALWTATGGAFIPHQFIYGDEDSDTRRQALKDFAERKLPVLIASTIVDEGVDVPTVDALILAGSRKSRIKTMQRLGRGLRGEKLIAVEFANYCHDYLLRHSLTRYEDYKKEDCFPLYTSNPDVDLIRKLWNGESNGPKAR